MVGHDGQHRQGGALGRHSLSESDASAHIRSTGYNNRSEGSVVALSSGSSSDGISHTVDGVTQRRHSAGALRLELYAKPKITKASLRISEYQRRERRAKATTLNLPAMASSL